MSSFILSNLIQLKALAVAVVIAAVAGGPAYAAPSHKAHKSSDDVPKLKRPHVKDGVLTVNGSKRDDTIVLRLKDGNPNVIEVDAGGDGSANFHVDRNKVDSIDVDGREGNDTIRIDESGGIFTDTIPTTLEGGAGDDSIAGGTGAEQLSGDDGNDTIDGNKGSDTAVLGAGDDLFIWDNGDGSDVVEGQDGNDVMRFNGAAVAEQVDISAVGNRLRFFRTQGNITMDTAGLERVDFNGLGGADSVVVNDLSGTGVKQIRTDLGTADGAQDHVTINGTAGADTVAAAGSNGTVDVVGLAASVNITHAEPANDTLTINSLAGQDVVSAGGLATSSVKYEANTGDDDDFVIGSSGNDLVNGGKGTDNAFLGAGDDTFVWNPGEGSDNLSGQGGIDTMRFNGAAVPEQVDLSAVGSHLRFFRTQATITMDTVGLEKVDFAGLGGADTVTVHSLAGTDVTDVHADLGAADGAADNVIVEGTAGDDTINVSGGASAVNVTGLAAAVAITGHEATDRLDVNTLAGTDTVNSGGLAAGVIGLFVDGVLVP